MVEPLGPEHDKGGPRSAEPRSRGLGPRASGASASDRSSRAVGETASRFAAAAFGFFVVFDAALGAWLGALGALVGALGALLAPRVYRRTRSTDQASSVYLAGYLVCVVGGVVEFGGFQGPVMPLLALPPATAMLAGTFRLGLMWAIPTATAYVCLYLARHDIGWESEEWTEVAYARVTLFFHLSTAFFFFAVTGFHRLRVARAYRRRDDARARAEHAHAAARAVLDHVSEGLAVVTLDGRLGPERSTCFERWFGPVGPTSTLAERVGSVDPAAGELIALAWPLLSDPLAPAELVLEQLPAQARGEGRIYALEYSVVVGSVTEILVVVRDLTEVVAAEDERNRQAELMRLVERLSHDPDPLVDFHAEAGAIVEALANGRLPLDVERRRLHTLKGLAGMVDLRAFASFLHGLEDDRERGPLGAGEQEQLTSWWAQIDRLMRPVLRARRDELYRSFPGTIDLETLVQKLGSDSERSALSALARGWRGEAVEARLDRLAEQARVLAGRLGRHALRIETSVSPGLRLPAHPRWRAFWTECLHCIRNALDHGLEPSAERELAGKPRAGRLLLQAQATADGGVEIAICDDGRGIDWARVAAEAERRGLPIATHADRVAALFADGLSTREKVSEVSGRGVGTSALGAACEALGGRIEVTSEPGQGTSFVFRFPAQAVRAPEANPRPGGDPEPALSQGSAVRAPESP